MITVFKNPEKLPLPGGFFYDVFINQL